MRLPQPSCRVGGQIVVTKCDVDGGNYRSSSVMRGTALPSVDSGLLDRSHGR